MSSERASAAAPTRVHRHLVEWGLLVIVVLVVVLLLMRQTLVTRSQAELAAIKTTIAALRTAMALHHLEAQVVRQTTSVASQQRNPFDLLQRIPANYLGEMNLTSAENAAPGSWIFETVCGCVGYVPIDGNSDVSPDGTKIIWLRVGAPSEPSQLVVLKAYQWQGQPLD